MQRKFLTILVFPILTFALLGSSLSAREFDYNQAMKKETQTVVFMLENYHYSQKFVSNGQAQELIENFMEDLDYNHVFFLDSDREEMVEKHAPQLERRLRRGDLTAAFDIYNRYEERVLDRIRWVDARLEQPFDFTQESEYVVDREEFPWPSSTEEMNQLWNDRMKYELLFDLLNDKTNEEAIEAVQKRYNRLEKNLLDLETVDVQEIFLTTLTRLFDPHSVFLSSDTLEDFAISMSLSLTGIGAILSMEDGYCTIRQVVPGEPADRDGRLQPGDKIVSVGQSPDELVDVIDMKLRKIVKMIRGEIGTTVYLEVNPVDANDPSETVMIDIVRDTVQITASRASASLFEMEDETGADLPIGVIELPSFYGDISLEGEKEEVISTTQDVEELINRLKDQNIKGLVLDLRNNGGGLLNEAVDLAGLFIKTGPVVQVKNTRGFIRRDWDRNEKISYEGPLIVLVSRYSASASEIVAGALQYYHRALIVGDKSTHGKGTVQAVLEINKLASPSFFEDQPTGATKITIQKFYLPDGKSTQNKGVISDIALPSINEFLPIGESDLPHAMAWDEIKPVNWTPQYDEFGSKYEPINDSTKDYLRDLSEERQKDLEEFTFLKDSIDWFRERQDKVSFSLNLDERKATKESEKTVRDALKDRETELQKLFYPSTHISLVDTEEGASFEDLMETPQDEESEDSSEDASSLAEEAEGVAGNLDIHLRESLRILVDWIEMVHKTETAASSGQASNDDRG